MHGDDEKMTQHMTIRREYVYSLIGIWYSKYSRTCTVTLVQCTVLCVSTVAYETQLVFGTRQGRALQNNFSEN